MEDGSKRVRRRALRAARVVTLGLVLAAPGCYQAHGTEPSAADAGEVRDAVADAAVFCDRTDRTLWVECCDAIGWDWERGCAAWGPFVPPGEVA